MPRERREKCSQRTNGARARTTRPLPLRSNEAAVEITKPHCAFTQIGSFHLGGRRQKIEGREEMAWHLLVLLRLKKECCSFARHVWILERGREGGDGGRGVGGEERHLPNVCGLAEKGPDFIFHSPPT